MEFPAAELGDTGILSEAVGQLLIHLLCLLWRKEMGAGEPLKPGSSCLAPVGWRLEGAGLLKSAAGWHVQHHLLHPGLDTASEPSGKGFLAHRERLLIPKCCGDISSGICLMLYKALGHLVGDPWLSGAAGGGDVLVDTAQHEWSVCPSGQGGQWHPDVYQPWCSEQDQCPSLYTDTAETHPVPGTVWGPVWQESH